MSLHVVVQAHTRLLGYRLCIMTARNKPHTHTRAMRSPVNVRYKTAPAALLSGLLDSTQPSLSTAPTDARGRSKAQIPKEETWIESVPKQTTLIPAKEDNKFDTKQLSEPASQIKSVGLASKKATKLTLKKPTDFIRKEPVAMLHEKTKTPSFPSPQKAKTGES